LSDEERDERAKDRDDACLTERMDPLLRDALEVICGVGS
jgi:hypothetical protein